MDRKGFCCHLQIYTHTNCFQAVSVLLKTLIHQSPNTLHNFGSAGFDQQVFVEFENATQRCSWVQVYDEGVKAVLVEDFIVWANKSDDTTSTGASTSATAWPALVSDHMNKSLHIAPTEHKLSYRVVFVLILANYKQQHV